ncbi:insulinase family protein [bacterium]|nr:insulinase family protein [bacterium]
MIDERVLDNGVTLLCEPIEHVKSVSIAVWINTRPAKDWGKTGGIRHFIEHLVFKGTKKRTAKEIANSIEGIGGVLDAWTDHESTVFMVKVLDKHMDIGVDVLSDLVSTPLFEPDAMKLERTVVLDEILRETNDPTSNSIMQFLRDVWPKHPHGMSLLGNQSFLRRLARETILEYYNRNYVGKNMVVACSGNIDPQRFADIASEAFGKIPPGDDSDFFQTGPPEFVGKKGVYTRKFDHINICLGVEGLPYMSPDRFEFAVLDTLLGSGASSRLFQEIREKHGLCYDISSFSVRRRDAGIFAIHSATGPKKMKRLIKLIMAQLRLLVNEGVSNEETEATKEQLKGAMMLALESTSARVLRLAKSHIYFDKILSLDEICAKVDAVSTEAVSALARKLFGESELALSIVGNLDKTILDKLDLSV